jgi:hypothetical protein
MMSESPEIPANPVLSPGFDRARKLSRILVVLLGLGFVSIILAIIGVAIYGASPELQALIAEHSRRTIPRFTWGKYALLVLHAIPCLLALLYARRLFARFAEGDVFSLGTIALMRTAALWIVLAGVLPPDPLTIVIGMATYVAAYVMAEARRLADDSASIV